MSYNRERWARFHADEQKGFVTGTNPLHPHWIWKPKKYNFNEVCQINQCIICMFLWIKWTSRGYIWNTNVAYIGSIYLQFFSIDTLYFLCHKSHRLLSPIYLIYVLKILVDDYYIWYLLNIILNIKKWGIHGYISTKIPKCI